MIKLTLNEAQAEWGAATLARIGEGVATGGVALPVLMAESFAEYLLTVRGLTPPAKGARVVGSVELSRGKAAIDVDLRRAFIVAAKGAISTVAGGKLGSTIAKRIPAKIGRKVASRIAQIARLRTAKRVGRLAARGVQAAGKKAVKEVLSAADEDPQSWYEKQRRNGRFRGTTRMEIDTTRLEVIRRSLHARVGYLQSGWNAASERFRVPTPSWVSGKNGRGTVNVDRSDSRLQIRAENQVTFADDITGMQRRLNFAAQLVAKRMERRSKEAAEKAMQQIIDT